MGKLKRIIFNTDVYKCAYLFCMCVIIFAIELINADSILTHLRLYVLVFFALWGMLLTTDKTGKFTFLKLRGIWLLLAFLALNAVTILMHLGDGGLYNNLESFLFFITCTLLLCPSDDSASVKSKYKAIFVFYLIFAVPITLVSAVSLYDYVTSSGIVIGEYAAANPYRGRLTAFSLNWNNIGMFAAMSVASSFIIIALLKDIYKKLFAVWIWRILCVIFAIINITMLISSGSRAAYLALLAFILLFSFFAFSHFLASKTKSVIIRSIAAATAAVAIAGATYLVDRPIYTGVDLLKTALTREETDVGLPIEQPGDGAAGLPQIAATRLDDMNIDDARLTLWSLGLDVIKQYPIFGVSTDRVKHAMQEAAENRPEEEITAIIIDGNIGYNTAHNAYIFLAVANGIPALIFMLLFFVLFAKRNLVILFKTINMRSSLTAGAILSLCAAIAFHAMAEDYLFNVGSTCAITFWSGLSFGAALLSYSEICPAEDTHID